MIASHPHSIFARGLAALVWALAFALAGWAAVPASADQSQWVQKMPHWWDQSNGWRHQMQWPNQWDHQRHFNSNFNGCFGSCGPQIVFNNGGAVFVSPGLVVGNPGFVVRQPAFIVNQPAFIIRQPAFIIRQPGTVILQPGQHMHHNSGQGMHWRRPMSMSGSGVRITRPGTH
ncbi:MAG: hypothetical protein R3D05_14895 [Dongiaceae bacterium]